MKSIIKDPYYNSGYASLIKITQDKHPEMGGDEDLFEMKFTCTVSALQELKCPCVTKKILILLWI